MSNSMSNRDWRLLLNDILECIKKNDRTAES
jgi:hypothetical protein